MLDAGERGEIEAKDFRQREAEEAEQEVGIRAGGRGNAVEFSRDSNDDKQNSRPHGCGTQEAVADLKAVLLKHFGIRDGQSWATVVVTIDYLSNTLTVNQTLQLVAPVPLGPDSKDFP